MRAARACGVGVCDAMWRWVPAAHGVQIFEKHDVNHDGELNFVGTCLHCPPAQRACECPCRDTSLTLPWLTCGCAAAYVLRVSRVHERSGSTPHTRVVCHTWRHVDRCSCRRREEVIPSP